MKSSELIILKQTNLERLLSIAGQSNIPPIVIRQILQSNNEAETQRILNTYSKNKGLIKMNKI